MIKMINYLEKQIIIKQKNIFKELKETWAGILSNV
jgi:hypothetical protein